VQIIKADVESALVTVKLPAQLERCQQTANQEEMVIKDRDIYSRLNTNCFEFLKSDMNQIRYL
jgi:hypothetical protein